MDKKPDRLFFEWTWRLERPDLKPKTGFQVKFSNCFKPWRKNLGWE